MNITLRGDFSGPIHWQLGPRLGQHPIRENKGWVLIKTWLETCKWDSWIERLCSTIQLNSVDTYGVGTLTQRVVSLGVLSRINFGSPGHKNFQDANVAQHQQVMVIKARSGRKSCKVCYLVILTKTWTKVEEWPYIVRPDTGESRVGNLLS